MSTLRLVEDILSICCNSKKLFTLAVLVLVLNAISVTFLITPKRIVSMIKSSVVLSLLFIIQ